MDVMFVIALCFNIVILVPVVTGLLKKGKGMDETFGPDSTARRILTCIYATIAAASVLLIVLHVRPSHHAEAMTLVLFFLQTGYKLGTVALVGVGNPVVITNLVVVTVQVVAVVQFALQNKLPL